MNYISTLVNNKSIFCRLVCQNISGVFSLLGIHFKTTLITGVDFLYFLVSYMFLEIKKNRMKSVHMYPRVTDPSYTNGQTHIKQQ